MRGMRLDALRTLIDVVELGSFSAAARRQNLSQPAISQQVRELEDRLGVSLVERLGKRAYATRAGAELIESARRIEREVDAAVDAMRRHREGRLGRVRIGTGEAILTYLLPPVLRVLSRDHANIELAIAVGSTARIVERLSRNEIDIGLVTLPVDDRALAVTRLRDDAMVAILPPSARRVPAVLTAQALARYPLILDSQGAQMHELARDWLRAGGVDPRPALEVGAVEAIKNVVASGLGASILPVEGVMGGVGVGRVVIRPLSPPLMRSLALVQRRDKGDDPALTIVRDALAALATRKLPRRRAARGG